MINKTFVLICIILIALSKTLMSQPKPFVPSDFKVPDTLETSHFRVRMLTVNDVVKDYDAVIDAFSTILAKPDHNKRLDEDLYFYRGQSYYHKNEYNKALEDLDQSLTLEHYQKGMIYW